MDQNMAKKHVNVVDSRYKGENVGHVMYLIIAQVLYWIRGK